MTQSDDDDPPPTDGPLAREERLRRVAKLCVHFARNMAYYRAARKDGTRITPLTNFWNTTDGNFIDTAVLEWCKVFADPKAHQYWGKICTDQSAFEAGLLAAVGMDKASLEREIATIRTYRDKFLAHLDSERIAFVPHLDPMWTAVQFCFDHVLKVEMTTAEAARVALPDLMTYYGECFAEAENEYARRFRFRTIVIGVVVAVAVTAIAMSLLQH